MMTPETYNFNNLSRNETIKRYIEGLSRLKDIGRNHAISNEEFDGYLVMQYFNNTSQYGFQQIRSSSSEMVKHVLSNKRKFAIYLFLAILSVCIIQYKRESSSIVLRNIQGLIYPGMRYWRKLTLPLLKHFPELSKLYDESCLVPNPFFQIADLNCEPCMNVMNVIDLTPATQVPLDSNPYIFKSEIEPMNLEKLHDLYESSAQVFKDDAFKIDSTNKKITNLEELFDDFLNNSQHSPSHNMWKCNRMAPARLLRQIIPRPYRLPDTGVSLERFLAIDSINALPYRLPDTECSKVFIFQALGSRTIILRPTTECRDTCRSISVRLPTTYILSYDWWYWKPISVPDQHSINPSITYIGSYC